MKSTERRRYEMLLRIRDFGDTHREAFAGSSTAREAFEAVNTAVRELATTDLLKFSASMAARADRKAAARTRLIKLLVRVGQLARVLRASGRTLPPFALPRSSSDERLLMLARQFAQDAASWDAEFSGHGVGPTVIRRVAAAFDATVRDRAMKLADRTGARTRMHEVLTSAMLDVRRLDLIVDHALAGDTVTRVVWKQLRRVEGINSASRGQPGAALRPTAAAGVPLRRPLGTPAEARRALRCARDFRSSVVASIRTSSPAWNHCGCPRRPSRPARGTPAATSGRL